jgi:S1-C subfamily serine protease
VDGTPTGSLPLFGQSLYLHGSGEHVKLGILRGPDRLQLDVSLAERPHKVDSLVDSVDPVKSLVSHLGILGVELDPDLAHSLPDLRIPTGVIVVAKTLGSGTGDVPLQTGDVIHGLNGVTVTTMAGLRDGLGKLSSGDAAVLWIERYGQLIYVTFVM